jgi:hypothetical protein
MPVFWFFVRVACYQLWVVILCMAVACLTTWLFSIGQIDDAYEREVVAIRKVAVNQSIDKRLPVEVRGQRVAAWVRSQLEGSRSDGALPGKRDPILNGVADTVHGFTTRPWVVNWKTTMLRFIPLAYMRMETYFLISWSLLPLVVIAFTLGTARSKSLIGEGYHKRNFLPHYLRTGFWIIRDTTVACAGFVMFPAVVWWVVPTVLFSCIMVYVWRAYSIQYV